MPRPIWKGQISFGLVNIPVAVHSAERRANISFRLIDSRNTARIRYERVNEETGEEVPWNAIVKGYEYADESYVLLTEKDLERANVEMTRVIEIEQFVDLAEIDSVYFDRPYYLVPGEGGEKGYILLREALHRTGKAGIAKVVIRTRQSLAAITADGDALVLDLLRFQQEVVSSDKYDIPGRQLKKYRVTAKEIELAEQLVKGMTAPWKPEQYQDEYHDAIMQLIERRIKAGQTAVVEEPEEESEEPAATKTINFMDMLKKSVAAKTKTKRAPAKKRGRKKTKAS
ncbi:non-homologous end joining protein Ku [Planctomicrobium piriforme]|uniref:Non-homologous end joining protein Ku n=1 Tax=Planctomicrobium piriforme TaxID=1576369 RepID=A0A1I3RZN4_9PLAN|nr:Ku protein [Planctomicrobium piriforme]SFJ51935.1 DNA end-binding protein Ku [Planctomicrobium piriforme]